jgi:outer membrane protein, heavy metal efflux system
MGNSALRRLLGASITILVLTGCGGPGPFTDQSKKPHDSGGGAAWTAAAPRGVAESAAREKARSDLPPLSSESDLEDYLRFAALNNPGLEARFQEWRVAVEQVPQSGSLPDPRFTYGHYFGEVETRVGPMQHQFSLSQSLPWPGKLRDREDAAAHRANAAYARFEAARLGLFYQVEAAHNRLYYLKRNIDITTDMIELLKQFERVAQTRYQVGRTGHPDLLKIQVELGLAEDRLRELVSRRAPYAAELNASLNRDASSDIAWPTAVSARVIAVSEVTIRAAMRERNPELQALDQELESKRIGVQIAREESLPDLIVGLAYTVIGERGGLDLDKNGDDAILATFSLNLPLWRENYNAVERGAMAERLAAASRKADSLNTLTAQLQQSLFDHQDADRRATLYRDTLVPKAEESLEAALSSYTQDQADFLDLIEAQRTLLEFKLTLERTLVERATSYAHVEQLVGAPLSSLSEVNGEEEPNS